MTAPPKRIMTNTTVLAKDLKSIIQESTQCLLPAKTELPLSEMLVNTGVFFSMRHEVLSDQTQV